MRTTYLRFVAWMGALALASAMVPGAVAECGLPSRLIKPMAWQPQSRGAQPTLLRTAFDADDEGSIVGMWHVLLTAHTMNGQAIPNTVIDNSLAVWHRDGTEIMNSLRPAQDGNFCLGVWKRTGQRSYLLNHIPWGGNVFDPDGAAGCDWSAAGRGPDPRERYAERGRGFVFGDIHAAGVRHFRERVRVVQRHGFGKTGDDEHSVQRPALKVFQP